MTSKPCFRCQVLKPLTLFTRSQATPDGHLATCKECVKESLTSRLKVSPTEKVCTKCSTMKPIGEFPKNKRTRDGHQTHCKLCHKKYRDEKTPSQRLLDARNTHYKAKFGIDFEEYLRILRGQGDKCAICGKRMLDTDRLFHVDHNHVTGKIRGILCGNCNLGVGNFQDSPDILRNAITYLQENVTENSNGAVPV